MPKVLIVEDDLMIADMIESVLVEHGHTVCGTARTVTEALALARRHKPDLAVIDVRLDDDELGTAFVARLGGIGGLGVLYATGNKLQLIGADGHAYITKPYRDLDLVRALEIVAEIVATGVASPPFPRGLQVLPRLPAARAASKNV